MSDLTHDLARNFLHKSLDGLLTQSECAWLHAHLSACASCRADFEQLALFQAALVRAVRVHLSQLHSPPSMARVVKERFKRMEMKKRVGNLVFALSGIAVFLLAVIVIGRWQSFSLLPASSNADGNGRIALTSERDGNLEIYLMNPDGSALINLTNHPAQDAVPAWSPDGKKIAFLSDRAGKGDFDIYVMNANGSAVTRLTDDAEAIGFGMIPVMYEPIIFGFGGPLSWSPDGRYILTSRLVVNPKAANRETHSHLAIVKADGSGMSILTPVNYFKNDFSPAWSSNGDWIAFSRFLYGRTRLLAIKPDGTGETALTYGYEYAGNFAWTPDGKNIAYFMISPQCLLKSGTEFLRECQSHKIRLVNADSATAKDLFQFGSRSVYGRNMAWSPDGMTLVVVALEFVEGDSARGTSLYLINADGKLVFSRPISVFTSDDSFPSWSPDGSRLVFSAWKEQNREIYLLDAAQCQTGSGCDIVPLAPHPALDAAPQWRP